MRWACRCSERLRSLSAFLRKPCWRWRFSRWFEKRQKRSEAFAGDHEQHLGPFVVEASDFACFDRHRTPVAGAGVSLAQPVRRRIIVIAIELVAPVFLARLEAGVEMAARLQRTPYQRQ